MGMHPVPDSAPITQEYGANPSQINGPNGHSGRDYGVNTGTPIVSLVDGVVRWADWCTKLPGGPNGWAARWFLSLTFGGIVVVVEHDDCFAITAHLSRTDLNPGDVVRKGQVIGYSGATGLGTGPHAHTEILPKPVNYGIGSYGRINPGPYHLEPYRPLTSKAPAPAPRAMRNGVDVSSHQPADITKRVAADFVIVKVTEGTGYVNPFLGEQVAAARARGAAVGLYHFATAQASSDDEAAAFLRVARPYLDAGAVAFLDWEPAGLASYTAWAEDWLRRVDHVTGRTTGIYMNLGVSRLASWSAFVKAHPLWLAYYGAGARFDGYATSFHPPAVPGWRLALWQYTEHGRLPGYGRDLDLNVYLGGIAAWDKATGTATIAAPDIDPLEGLLDMDQKTFDKQKKIPGTPAWHLANGRDHSANLTVAVKTLTALVKGVPASVLQAKVTRKGVGAGSAVTQAETLAYDKDNWERDRANQKKILEQQAQILALLTEKKEN